MSAEDADGDSQMHSSPEPDSFDDQEMFPDEGGPTTPTNTFQAYNPPSSELSPPNSQGQSGRTRSEVLPPSQSSAVSNPAINSNGKRTLAGTAHPMATNVAFTDNKGQSGVSTSAGYAWEQSDEPGWIWKNKKAQEEYARAMEQIIDKHRMIGNKYGDIAGPDFEMPPESDDEDSE